MQIHFIEKAYLGMINGQLSNSQNGVIIIDIENIWRYIRICGNLNRYLPEAFHVIVHVLNGLAQSIFLRNRISRFHLPESVGQKDSCQQKNRHKDKRHKRCDI